MTAGQSCEARKLASGSQQYHSQSTAPSLRSKNFETHFYSASRSHHCDGYGAKLSVLHGLACKKGGLVTSRHNEIRDELSNRASKAFIPSTVRDEPKIYFSRSVEKKTAWDQPNPSVTRNHPKTQSEDRGDLLIRGLWARGTDCIIDVRVTDTYANSNRSKDPAKVLAAHEREKKKKYISRHASHNDVILLRSWSPQMVFSVGKRNSCCRSYLPNSLRSGRSRTPKCVAMSTLV
jgi:hypothetical protein